MTRVRKLSVFAMGWAALSQVTADAKSCEPVAQAGYEIDIALAGAGPAMRAFVRSGHILSVAIGDARERVWVTVDSSGATAGELEVTLVTAGTKARHIAMPNTSKMVARTAAGDLSVASRPSVVAVPLPGCVAPRA